MHTRSQTRNLHNQQQQAPPAVVEPFNLEDPFENPPPPPPPPMDDQRTMAQLLEAPTEGYEDAIVVPEINANFELKHGLINLEVLLKMNLPDHRSVLTDPEVNPTRLGQMTKPHSPTSFIANYFITVSSKDGDGDTSLQWSQFTTQCSHLNFPRKFQFPADFVVVDFEPDPRVPLILGRSFLKTSRALIDVYQGKITLRLGREAITFNLDQTLRYTANYNHMTANQINVIDMACEEYSQEVLGFSDMISSGNPTPYYDPIISTSSPILPLFGDSNFLLFEEADSFLAIEDDPTSPEVDPTYYDPDGDILLLEAILNINEPPEVELKDLPPHLEYAFLEGNDKLPVIIAKDLKNDEKAALIEVLKSHKRAIAWKLSDIKGINPEFCTHKILMEEDYIRTDDQHQGG
ncbi:reverse transcriptase domain-containing protein [Tanacetum coccineum]|uniref:Reverse transcriptase domain-containing protein n=1 Tax=Tanacetum coccineum TaxID=301880 RepID=A0ABQ5EXY2_9ASTR